jgi:TonB family protein
MRRFFILIIIGAFASAGASASLAQARRIRRAEPPKDERAGKSETKDETKDEAKDKPQGERAQADDEDQPQTGQEVSKRAVIKSKPNPGYPPEARGYGVRGVVKLRIILGSDGKVRDKIEVLEGLPHGVTEEAIKAARRIAFEPAQKDGRPVSQYVTVIYHFNLY